MIKQELENRIAAAVQKVRESNPMAPSITNFVTINFVANAQIAVGGAAAMVFMPDEAERIAQMDGAMYVNVGTLMPSHRDVMLHVAKKLREEQKPWVLDPVAIGIGSMRTEILHRFKEEKPSIIRGNPSEILALAGLWELEGGTRASTVRGVDSTDPVENAREAAVALARWTGGAVAVSGVVDLVTDGELVVYSHGGSHFMERITGAGCALGGVCAVYASCADPFMAALTATQAFNLAGKRAGEASRGPGSFEGNFLDELYLATPEEVAANPFQMETEEVLV